MTEGVYEIDAPLKVSSSIVLRAAENAEVVLSGGQRLDGLDWRVGDGGVMSAALPDDLDLAGVAFDQLYLNGQRQDLARYPNYDPNEHYLGGTSKDALSRERIAGWQDPAGGYIHALHDKKWGGNHWQITGKNDDGSLAMEGGWMNNRGSGLNSIYRFVENIYEELDAPGEWYLDREQRILSIIPPTDTNIADAKLVVSGIDQLIQVVGQSPDDPAGGLRLSGVALSHTARTFMKTNEPLLRSDWKIHRGGAIYLENAKDVVIEDCVFIGLGGNAVFASGFAETVVVRGCHFTDIGASAVCFVGKPEAVRTPQFQGGRSMTYEEIDHEPGPKTQDYPRDCLVEDCLMHDLGTVELQVAGVQISMAARITARYLSIYDVPRAGINISEGTWGGHLIEWCDVFDTVKQTGDHGSFNSWGRDRFWMGDRASAGQQVLAHPELPLLDAVQTTVIRNSRWRCDHGWDIDLDDGSSNYEIYNNLCLNGGIKLREGYQRNVYNNIMVNNTLHPHDWFPQSGDIFERNIVMSVYEPRIMRHDWGDRINHNLLPDPEALARTRGWGMDPDSAVGSPMFIDPAEGDFRVAEDSPALELGFVNFPMDRFGVQKPALKSIARTPTIPALD